MDANDTKQCPHCLKDIPIEDNFCSFCGESIKVLSDEERQKIKKASKWLLAVSILFFIFGTIHGFINKWGAEKAKKNLAQYEDSFVIGKSANGKNYTVKELKSKIDRRVILGFLKSYFLTIVMFGLYIWAKKTPFPAMVTALCIVLALEVFGGIINPSNIFRGILIKIFFIGALIAGIKASLATRKVSKV